MSEATGATRPPYENYGVSRSVIEQNASLLGNPEEEAKFINQACESMQFSGVPKDGWARIARELRIIRLQLPELKTQDSLSRAQMAKQCTKYSDQLWKIASGMNEMAWQEDYTMAAIESKGRGADEDKFEYANLPNRLFEMVAPMKKFASWLELSSKIYSRKTRPASERERRLVLACKLMPLFEEQFGSQPKLKGGSSSRAIENESSWAQFYQAAAALVLGENVTPDRQSVLREATLPIK